jgi:TPP-dependent indolepyruvate ferredoxin oxidoreductase alpha subunit
VRNRTQEIWPTKPRRRYVNFIKTDIKEIRSENENEFNWLKRGTNDRLVKVVMGIYYTKAEEFLDQLGRD